MKNIIFDFGQVLVHFIERDIAERICGKEDLDILHPVLFDRIYWDPWDAGNITEREIIEQCKLRLPGRLHEKAEKIISGWYETLPLMEGMPELWKELKKKGYQIYVLSNICPEFIPHRMVYPYFHMADGAVFSGECHLTKPNAEIFEYLFKKYRLDPSECLFVDDNRKNIAGAEKVGLPAYLFDGNVEKLREVLL